MFNSDFLRLAAFVFALMPTVVTAQSRNQFLEAFAGDWIVFDPAFSTTAAPCSMRLSSAIEPQSVVEESQLRRTATVSNCVPMLNQVTAWDIDQNQLVLLSEQDTLVARLGGNQTRVTGDIENSFVSIILERATGDEWQVGFSDALRRHRCIYSGYSSTCVTPEDMAEPVMSEEGNVVASLQVLVRLNVRDQPRRDALIVGTLQQNTCLRVNFCTTASDGLWCRARFGEASGWVSKTAIRQNEWPVMTFSNGCQ